MKLSEKGKTPEDNCDDPCRPIILALGVHQDLQQGLRPFRVVAADNVEQVLQSFKELPVSALIIGPRVKRSETLAILTESAHKPLMPIPNAVIILSAMKPDISHRFLDAGRFVYATGGEISPRDLRSLIVSGLCISASVSEGRLLLDDCEHSDRLLEFCTRFQMQTDLASAGLLLMETARDLLRAEIVRCLLYDHDAKTLTPADASGSEKGTHVAASGLTAFVVHTGKRVCLENMSSDCRYDSDLEGPPEMSCARFLAEPIIGYRGLSVGALVALRGSEQPAFSGEDVRLIETLALCSAPTFNQLVLQKVVQDEVIRRAAVAEEETGIFRQEALDYHFGNLVSGGEVLNASLPLWLRRSFWWVMGTFLLSLVALGLLQHTFVTIFDKLN